MADPIGRTIAERFLIEGVLGSGGMGVVYLALDQASQRRVAIKLASAAQSETQVARFIREGEVSAALDHPGIVRIYSAGAVGQRPYLVYELVEGARELGQVLPELEVPARVDLVSQVARALGYAHAKGVVHRDVKPANVLVDQEGRSRLVDFGIARLEGAERLTATGAFVGTPHYMSPEAFRGKESTPASDVWSTGVLLYEALTGELPFSGSSIQELAPQIALAQPTPPSRVMQNVPRRLEEVCLRCLRADPAERYPNGEALAEDLGRALRDEDLSADVRRNSKLAVLALSALALLALAGVYALSTSRETASTPTPTASASATPSAAADPGVRWRLERDDRFRGVLFIDDTWMSRKPNASPLHFEVLLDLEYRVRSVRGTTATLDATLQRLVLAADSFRLDSRPNVRTTISAEHVNGQELTILLQTDTGLVKRVHGANLIRESLIENAGIAKSILEQALGSFNDEVVQGSLNQAFQQLSPADPRPESWVLKRRMRINTEYAFSYEANVSQTDTGTRWTQRRWTADDVSPGSLLKELEIQGTSIFKRGRVAKSETQFKLVLLRDGTWHDLDYAVSYNEVLERR
jgi:serine/threonine protein kinase